MRNVGGLSDRSEFYDNQVHNKTILTNWLRNWHYLAKLDLHCKHWSSLHEVVQSNWASIPQHCSNTKWVSIHLQWRGVNVKLIGIESRERTLWLWEFLRSGVSQSILWKPSSFSLFKRNILHSLRKPTSGPKISGSRKSIIIILMLS